MQGIALSIRLREWRMLEMKVAEDLVHGVLHKELELLVPDRGSMPPSVAGGILSPAAHRL